MKFDVKKASDSSSHPDGCGEYTMEIKTLKELITFIKNANEDIIIHVPRKKGDNFSITIYDYYVE